MAYYFGFRFPEATRNNLKYHNCLHQCALGTSEIKDYFDNMEVVEEDQHDELNRFIEKQRADEKVLMYTGRNVYRIPDVFWKLYGTKVEYLDLSYNNINSLNGLERFTKLRELILDHNQLSHAVNFPNIFSLETLSLNKNDIKDLAPFIEKVKTCFPNLRFLSLLGNKACPNQLSDPTKDEDDYRRYRFYVLHHLRKLKFLDSAPVTQEELKEAILKGRFMHIKKPKKPDPMEVGKLMSEDDWKFSPLPMTSQPVGEHKSAYGTYRSRYANKESEGNRFIVNNDL